MFEITNETKSKPPVSGLFFEKIKEEILGKHYTLSVVVSGNSILKKLNLKYRGKEKTTNILSFPLEKNVGEIFLNFSLIKKQAKDREIKFQDFYVYLFIHGLLHLKGHEHGSSMTQKEKYWLKKFNLPTEICGEN